MSLSMTNQVTKYHDRILQALTRYKGQVLKQKEIHKAYLDFYPECRQDIKWIMAADHCINHSNKGCCLCSNTDDALFERLGYNRYLIR